MGRITDHLVAGGRKVGTMAGWYPREQVLLALIRCLGFRQKVQMPQKEIGI